MPLGWGEVTGIIPKLVTQGPFQFSKWAFVTRLGIIFSFHLWQATREMKKPMPLPQPKGIKTVPLHSE